MLYESAARADEVLCLNVEDLYPQDKRGRITAKGGATEWIHWQSGTAQLLPRLIARRTRGPLFLTARKAPAGTPTLDVCPAEDCFMTGGMARSVVISQVAGEGRPMRAVCAVRTRRSASGQVYECIVPAHGPPIVIEGPARSPPPAVYPRRSAERPAKRAESPNSSSIRMSWLYFAVRSERESEPVLI